MRDQLSRYLSWPRVAVFFVGQLLMQQFLLRYLYPALTPSPSLPPPELRLHYGAGELYSYFAALGEQGRALYLSSGRIDDAAFAVLYGLAYTGLLIRLVEKLPRAAQWLWLGAGLPMLAACFDLAASMSNHRLLAAYPEKMDLLARAAGLLTTAKHVCAGLYALVLTVTVAGVIWRIATRAITERPR